MPYVYTEENPTVLMHYGHLGMKWGKHIFGDDKRFGANGRGKKTTKSADSRASKFTEERKPSQKEVGRAVTQELNSRVRNRRALSDDQLNSTINRLEKEKRLRELGESELTPAKSMIAGVLKKVGKETLTGLGYGVSSVALAKIAKKYGSRAMEIEKFINDNNLDLNTKKGKALAEEYARQASQLRFISEMFGTGSSYVKSKAKKK